MCVRKRMLVCHSFSFYFAIFLARCKPVYLSSQCGYMSACLFIFLFCLIFLSERGYSLPCLYISCLSCLSVSILSVLIFFFRTQIFIYLSVCLIVLSFDKNMDMCQSVCLYLYLCLSILSSIILEPSCLFCLCLSVCLFYVYLPYLV